MPCVFYFLPDFYQSKATIEIKTFLVLFCIAWHVLKRRVTPTRFFEKDAVSSAVTNDCPNCGLQKSMSDQTSAQNGLVFELRAFGGHKFEGGTLNLYTQWTAKEFG